jgi:chromosome segregation ATPase
MSTKTLSNSRPSSRGTTIQESTGENTFTLDDFCDGNTATAQLLSDFRDAHAKVLNEKDALQSTVRELRGKISELESKLADLEKRDQLLMRDKERAVRDLELVRKSTMGERNTVDSLKTHLQEEKAANASMIVYNRYINFFN